MTLFGVGAAAGNVTGTTLGRIGVGYVYADWYPQITWTTPGFAGVAPKLVFYKRLHYSQALVQMLPIKYPRVEAQLDYNFSVDLGAYVWVDGQYQNLSKTELKLNYLTPETIISI